ncbi:cell adhesion molecule DSCAM-like [Uloborus diversus]|uniref:cell adhesion molecule DSCAM-like n=1 Tax=Uloborus diversus TaxID=327109 RepID=UPI002409217F|nr:cell adhesion molecule DSCAM-like [Uloborus diversus]
MSYAKKNPEIGSVRFVGNMAVGARASIVCVIVNGDPPFTFTWLKDNREIKNVPDLPISTVDEFTSVLSVSKLDAESNGNYTCRVANRAGIDEKFDTVLVKAMKAPIVKPFHFSGEFSPGMRTVVMCTVIQGDPPFTFDWFKDGVKVLVMEDFFIKHFDEFTSNLIITNMGPQHNGNYTCRVTNSAGTDEQSDKLSMKGSSAPELSPLRFPSELKFDKRTGITCTVVVGDPPFQFFWFKDSEQLKDDAINFILTTDGFNSILSIPKLRKQIFCCDFSLNKLATKMVNSLLAVACLLIQYSDFICGSSAPELAPLQFPPVIKQGKRTVVTCTVLDGLPPFRFSWLKDGDVLKENREYEIATMEYSSVLSIPNTATSNGNYTCHVSNTAGMDEKHGVLLVKAIKAPQLKPFHFTELKAGMRISIFCTVVDGDPPFSFKWFKDSKEDNDLNIRSIDEFTSTLTITNLGAKHNGNYTCRVSNSAGMDEKSDSLSMKGAIPELAPLHFPPTVKQGKRTAVTCSVVDGQPPFLFSWLKNGEDLKNKRQYEITTTEYNSMLSISNPGAESNGNYTCRVSNAAGVDEKHDLLLVKALKAPKIKPFNFAGELSVGMRISIFCNVLDGDPPFNFQWFKDSQEEKDSNIKLFDEFTSTLIITNLGAQHNGNYTCKVSNAAGMDEKSDVLSMKGAMKPELAALHFSAEVKFGKRTAITCTVVDGEPPFTFSWYKDNILLKEDSNYFIGAMDGFNSMLSISKLDSFSNGNYTCKVTNGHGDDKRNALLQVKGSKLEVSSLLFPSNLKFGKRAAITCTVVDGEPPFRFSWFKDGVSLERIKGYSFIGNPEDITSILVITKLAAESNGNYTCKVDNAAGTVEKHGVLLVKGFSKPDIRPFRFSGNLAVGKRTGVVCVVIDGEPPFTFTWFKDGNEIKETAGFSVAKDDFTSTLFIAKLGAESNGNYSCRVSNKDGIDEKFDALLVNVSPQWVQEPKDLSAMGGQITSLDCFTRGYPKPNVSWKKKNDDGSDLMITESSRWKIAENGSLVFKKISKDDEGVYTCDVNNGVGEGLRKSARLSVKAPPRIGSAYRIKNARKAESTTLVCEAEGDQPLITSWSKNGVELQTTGRVQINEELSATGVIAQFTILSTHRNDGGSYVCSAKNKFGEVNNTIILRIVEPPERPLAVKVGEVWSRAATVSWSSPFDGNSPITQYVVHYWKDIEGASHRLQERNVPATQNSVLLNDLLPGTTYLLRVVAENDVGRGESSEPFKLRTEEEAPTAPPTDVTVIATGPTSVSVTWKAPPREHWNGRLLGYYVGHKRHQSMEPFAFHTVPAGRSTHADYRLTRLQKATRYSVVVKAFNSVGSGPESHELLVETSDKDSLKPPHLYVSETSDNTALLEWEHPRDLPDNVFTHYMVYYRPGAEGSWHSVHVPSKDKRFKLSSLESGTKYQVYLTAYSESGVSDPSDTLTLLTEGKALAPSIVSASGDTPYYLKLHFIVPVAASIVIIVIVIVVAWVWVKKAQFRDEREAARVSLYAEAYYTLPHKGGFFPTQVPMAAGAAGPTVTQDDAYDVPWDLPVARPKQ